MIESLALVTGAALGAFFFGGLWWTVQAATRSVRPAMLFLASFLIRMTIVLAGFYWIAAAGRWQPLLMVLLGFLIARLIATFLSRPQQEARHAPQS